MRIVEISAGADGARQRRSLARSLLRNAVAVIAGLPERIARAWRHRQAEHALGQLSDAMLKDIGTVRGEIHRRVRTG